MTLLLIQYKFLIVVNTVRINIIHEKQKIFSGVKRKHFTNTKKLVNISSCVKLFGGAINNGS